MKPVHDFYQLMREAHLDPRQGRRQNHQDVPVVDVVAVSSECFLAGSSARDVSLWQLPSGNKILRFRDQLGD